MPLRDHFHGPEARRHPWEALHHAWPAFLMADLNSKLPDRYTALPGVHAGMRIESDVATFDMHNDVNEADGGGVATAVRTAAGPTVTFETDLLDTDEYNVRVYDEERGSRLVATIEFVSPANKDRDEHRAPFVGKCINLLQNGVSVIVVDVVTSRRANLFGELLEQLGGPLVPIGQAGRLYAASCLRAERKMRFHLDAWAHELHVGQALPTLPLWLSETESVDLDLEATYQTTCRGMKLR